MYNNSIRNFIFLAPLEIISKIITTNICIPQKPPGDVCMCDRPRERERVRADFLPYFFPPFRDDSVRLYHHQNRLAVVAGCFVLIVVPLSFFLSVVCVIDDRVFLSRHYASQMIAQSGKTLMYGLVCVLVWVCPCRPLMDGGSYKNTTHTKKKPKWFFFSH